MFPREGMWSRSCLVWGSGEDFVRSPFAIRQINYNHNSLSYTTLFDFAHNPTTTKPRPSPHNSAEAASMLSSKLLVRWCCVMVAKSAGFERTQLLHSYFVCTLPTHYFTQTWVFWGLIHRSNLQTNCANFQFTSDASCRLWINSRVPHSAPFDHLKVPKLTREKAIVVAKTILFHSSSPLKDVVLLIVLSLSTATRLHL